ncbi:MAG: hypothetical protein AAFV90_14210 [Cyanobacteria bacterium J06634_5]
MFKSALPIALATSPLLLAAAQPPVLESISATCSLEATTQTPANDGISAVYPGEAQAVQNDVVVQPIANPDQALATSVWEMSAIADAPDATDAPNRWETALRLLLNNPYFSNQDADAPASTPLEATHCITQKTPSSVAMASQAIAKSAAVTSGTKALPSATEWGATPKEDAEESVLEAPAEDEAVDETFAPVPDLGAPAVEPAPVAAPVAEPAVEEAVTEETAAEETVTEEAVTEEAAEAETVEEDAEPAAVSDTEASDPEASDAEPSNSVESADDVPQNEETANPYNFTPTSESATPFDGSVVRTLEALPDGNYRYLAGAAEERAYTNEELRERGGSLFLLTKEGDTVTGDLLPRFGLPGICVTGTVEGNTVTGAAYPYDTTDRLQDSARQIGETYEPHGSGALLIRRTRTEGNGLYYAGAKLDLSGYTFINSGSSLPPESCTIGQTGGRDQD